MQLPVDETAESTGLGLLANVTLLVKLPDVDLGEDEAAVAAVHPPRVLLDNVSGLGLRGKSEFSLDEAHPLLLGELAQVLLHPGLDHNPGLWHPWHPPGLKRDP